LPVGFRSFSMKNCGFVFNVQNFFDVWSFQSQTHTLWRNVCNRLPSDVASYNGGNLAYLYVCGNTQTRVPAGILVLILQLTECYNSNRQCHYTCKVHWRAFWYQSKVRSSMSKNQVCAVENYVKREAFILITRQKYHYSVRSGRLYWVREFELNEGSSKNVMRVNWPYWQTVLCSGQ